MERICFIIKQKTNGAFYGPQQKLDLLVIRINKHDEIGKSRPCYNCLNILQTVGIKKVYYTTGVNNELICEYVKDMISIESSSSTIAYDVIKNKNNKNTYFEELLKIYIPKEIKYKNLMFFIEYNYKDVCPNFTYVIQNKNKNKNIKQILFYNEINLLIMVATII
jgi:uncharacterized CHY-type Zn-finger protein